MWSCRAACWVGGCCAVVLLCLPPASGSRRVTGGLARRSDKWDLGVHGGVAHEAREDLQWEAVPCLPAAVSVQASRSRIFVGGESLRSRRGAGSGPAGADGNVGPPSAGEAAPAARHAPGPAVPPPPGMGMPVPLRSWRGAAERSLPCAWLQPLCSRGRRPAASWLLAEEGRRCQPPALSLPLAPGLLKPFTPSSGAMKWTHCAHSTRTVPDPTEDQSQKCL